MTLPTSYAVTIGGRTFIRQETRAVVAEGMTAVIVLDKDSSISTYSRVCTYCRHWHVGPGRTCAAFPDGIPLPIWLGNNDHREPYRGDQSIRFEAQTGLTKATKAIATPRDAA
ncbi:MAG: hypothetical protein V2A73_07890, partial [Pseudomonadota bacterium]